MVDIFIFIPFLFSSSHSFLSSFFADLRCLHFSMNPLKKNIFQSVNYLGFTCCKVRRVQFSFFWMWFLIVIWGWIFFLIFTNPTSLICLSSLPIPFNNSHIGFLTKGDRLCRVIFFHPNQIPFIRMKRKLRRYFGIQAGEEKYF